MPQPQAHGVHGDGTAVPIGLGPSSILMFSVCGAVEHVCATVVWISGGKYIHVGIPWRSLPPQGGGI